MIRVLTGYRFSVYTRAVRMALHLRGLDFEYREIDPFDAAGSDSLRRLHPFGRVPILEDNGFHLWETQAILDYVSSQGSGDPLVPADNRARARMRQVMGIADNYIYWPLVRQAVSHAIFLEPQDDDTDRAMTIIAAGMAGAPEIMDVLDEIARDGLVLMPGAVTLADCHLWPMLDYGRMIPEGREALQARLSLARWAEAMEALPAAQCTRPDLSQMRIAVK